MGVHGHALDRLQRPRLDEAAEPECQVGDRQYIFAHVKRGCVSRRILTHLVRAVPQGEDLPAEPANDGVDPIQLGGEPSSS